MKTCCVVVIGHVDHGKTALVRALTGTETDRLPEEKARGLSIVPGFAHCSYPEGIVDLIDAPGHGDFVQAMITGAAGAQAALVVVSAREGIEAQTREHLRIASLLGIEDAVVALTKVDQVPQDALDVYTSNLGDMLASSPFSNAPILPCSAFTGEGVDALHAALSALLSRAPATPHPLKAFLPVDRVFTVAGSGTVVTGTLRGASLSRDGNVILQPTGRETSIRALQSRGADRARVEAGERVAVNLRGLEKGGIERGAVLVADDTIVPSRIMDVHLTLLPDATRGLKHMEDLRVSIGTAHAVAQIRLYGGGNISPGESAYAQLRFRAPQVAFAGQRAILRSPSPAETIGGATVLDPLAGPTRAGDILRLAVLKAAKGKSLAEIARALSEAASGVARLEEIARLSRTSQDKAKQALSADVVHFGSGAICPRSTYDFAEKEYLSALRQYHEKHRLGLWADRDNIRPRRMADELLDHVEAQLDARGMIRRAGNSVALADHDPQAHLTPTEQERQQEIEQTILLAGLNPIPLSDVLKDQTDPALYALSIQRGTLIETRNIALKQTLVFHRDTLATVATKLANAFSAQTPFTTSEARKALDTSRRVIVPVLEHFDAVGVTHRTGDTRAVLDVNALSQAASPC